MKNKSYIGISFIILVFGIIFIPRIIDRIQNDDVTRKNRLDSFEQETTSDLLVEIGPVPHFELTNHLGTKMSDKDYLGKVYLVEFFFSTCPTICPKMNENMMKIEKEYINETNFGIASISINPDTDTAEVLKNHAQHLGVSHPNCYFFTGNRDHFFEIANKGFNLYAGINPDVAGGFEHSGLFALVDKDGKIRCRKDAQGNPILYYDGLETSGVEAIKEDIKKLLEE
jgi:protein SCO1/2